MEKKHCHASLESWVIDGWAMQTVGQTYGEFSKKQMPSSAKESKCYK